jgi:hypothetical protein
VPINGWIDKKVIYTHPHKHTNTMGYYAATMKNETLLFAAEWLELEDIWLSETNQTQKDKYWHILICASKKDYLNVE